MKEFRQHQPTKREIDNVDKEHMYMFLYMIGNDEFYLRHGKVQNIGNNRSHRLVDSRKIVTLITTQN